MRIRVLVYNVLGFRDGVDRVEAVVSAHQPEVVLLNETGPRRRLRRLTHRLGMEAAADPWSPVRRRVKNAVLVRPPWRVVTHRLHRFPRSRRFYPRGALIARIGRSGLRLWAASVHLGLHPAERRGHAEELADLVRGLRGLAIVGGDLNDTPDGSAASHLAQRFWDAWTASGQDLGGGETFPAGDPVARIDYLFVSQGIGIADARVLDDPGVAAASDHRPLVAELELAVPAPPRASDGPST